MSCPKDDFKRKHQTKNIITLFKTNKKLLKCLVVKKESVIKLQRTSVKKD